MNREPAFWRIYRRAGDRWERTYWWAMAQLLGVAFWFVSARRAPVWLQQRAIGTMDWIISRKLRWLHTRSML